MEMEALGARFLVLEVPLSVLVHVGMETLKLIFGALNLLLGELVVGDLMFLLHRLMPLHLLQELELMHSTTMKLIDLFALHWTKLRSVREAR